MLHTLSSFQTESIERTEAPRIAVIGAGVAGAACAAGLLRAGFDVTVFDKSKSAGGRMSTRRAHWADEDGTSHEAEFDHGCPYFTATRPRFRAFVDRAESLGSVARWRQRLYAAFPAPRIQQVVVPTPNMPAFCRHLLSGVPVRSGCAVTGLQRGVDGWRVCLAGTGTDASDGGSSEGGFDQVIVAIPAAQAAGLLIGHHDDWAAALSEVRMAPCWTLMAATDEIDWPWDVAEPDRGVLATIVRNDRKPGRGVVTAGTPVGGTAHWVAHATAAWSLAHLEDDPAQVTEALCAALGRLLTSGTPPRWQHASVHRWRFAQLANPASGGFDCWWDGNRALGVCGDSFGDGSIEAAWSSGDELADAIAAAFDQESEPLAAPRHDADPRSSLQPQIELADPVH